MGAYSHADRHDTQFKHTNKFKSANGSGDRICRGRQPEFNRKKESSQYSLT